MSRPTRRARARVSVVTSAMALIAAMSLVGGSPAQAEAAPSGLKAVHLATRAIGLTWESTGQNAYRIRFSTSSSMSDPDTWDVIGNYFEWTRTDANPTVSAPRLSPGTTYYFQVKAITRALSSKDRENLSSYGSVVSVKTPASGYPELDPVGLKATNGGTDRLYVSWRSRGPGVRYVVRYTTDPSQSVLAWKSKILDVAGGSLTGLSANRRYHVRARVIDAAGKALSNYSDRVSARTQTTSNSPGLSVVTYNIRKPSGLPTWSTRRKPVAAAITGQAPDIVALQEATPITTDGVKQYTDILNLLGSSYAYVTREGSSGTKLAYNKDRMSVVTRDAVSLTTVGSATRYAVWALLEDKQTDKRVFVLDTHLEPGGYTESLNDARVKQAEEILKLIEDNNPGVPVLLLGDMNASRASVPENGPYLTFEAAGFVDPLNNRSASWEAGQGATVEHPIDIEYSTYNGNGSRPRITAYPVGTSIDYLWTSPGVRVATWRTVVSVDTARRYVGVNPSDHNMISARVHLP